MQSHWTTVLPNKPKPFDISEKIPQECRGHNANVKCDIPG